MHRTTNLLAGVVLVLASFAVAQDPQPASPQTPEDAMQPRQLVAWSSLQKPQPAPQPLPPPDTPIPQPGDDQQAKPPADPQADQSPAAAESSDRSSAAQSFVGKIVKDSGKYLLKVASNTTYQLEGESGDLTQYENQNVKVVGTLDKSTNAIHVLKIELLS
jgi:hypothetical protein